MKKVKVEKIAQLSGHSGAVYALEKGTEPHLFYSGSSDKIVAEWDLNSLSPRKFAAKLNAVIYAICHLPEKRLLIIGESTGGIHILDLEKKQEIKHFQHHTQPIFDIKYSSKTNCFYVLCWDGSFSVWSLNGEKSSAESPSSTAGEETRSEGFTLLKTIKLCNEKLRNADFNKDETEIDIGCGDSSIRIFDLETLKEKKKLSAHQFSVNAVKYHPNGRHLLSGARDAHLNIWDIEQDYQLIKAIPAHNYAIYSIVFSPDSKYFATASRDKTLKIWDATEFELLVRIDKEKHEGQPNSVNKLLWSSYNDYLISTGDDRTMMVWK
ncbi:MAG: WD40 repeat domain-containing protein, partial [Bacteroidetes bacterium]|nr:WD40 repeat domain-containing protein [Bacteroidota bacterium]